ncbi:hypothetical protein QO005_001711 [Rhizobium paknamense]|uniref:Uncharacterized protein n=1 Tax=Rhizobium paknamense TaxID=1206817 RepID=A0ABU0ICI0_9HYPH|nr:hypothetical protein [Rhizobium paknamense]
MEIEMMFGLFLTVMITVSALCAAWYARHSGD